MHDLSRRQFGQFLGAAAVVAAGHRLAPSWLVAQQAAELQSARQPTPLLDGLDFLPAPISFADDLVLGKDFSYELLLKQGMVINPAGDRYGDSNDYLAFLLRSPEDGWLWCNHETPYLPFLLDHWAALQSPAHAEALLKATGGSCLRMRRQTNGSWRPVIPDPSNFRMDGLASRLKLTGPGGGSQWVQGAQEVVGSVCNCGGGISPWGTFFSGEENTYLFWPDLEIARLEQDALELRIISDLVRGTRRTRDLVADHFRRPTEHYGYMVEIDPDTREMFKHTHLGRFAHENVAFAFSKDQRLVCYMGDDRMAQCIYKFVSKDPYKPSLGKANRNLLSEGTLYVADTTRGRWLPLDPEQQPALRQAKFDLPAVCVHTRTAARVVGGTPHARPEDVEVHPVTGDVFVSLTAYEPEKRLQGEAHIKDIRGGLARIREAGADAGAKEFNFDLFVVGSRETGLAWPDNLGFTENHHLLVTTDFKSDAKPAPESTQVLLGNNFLVLVPTSGPRTGEAIRLAVCPRGGEFCSPTLSPDRQELWVNVQHPGEGTTSRAELLSHWPDGGDALPASSMVAIQRSKKT